MFVSAGEYWRAPNKPSPAFPGYELSVPVMDEYVSGADVRLTLACDVYGFTNFDVGYAPGQSDWAWAADCSDANVGCFGSGRALAEPRTLFTVLATDGDATLASRMAKLYATALAHIPPAPAWTKAIALTVYDYFSALPPSPNGFDADMDVLAARIPPSQRAAVAVCVHGWYGLIGQYTLAGMNGTALLDEWTVFPDGAGYINPVTHLPVGPINVTKATIHARIEKARGLGFRTLLYFADGVNTCTGVPYFDEQSVLTTYEGTAPWKGYVQVARECAAVRLLVPVARVFADPTLWARCTFAIRCTLAQ